MKGQIVRGVAGSYMIMIDKKVYECKARGKFRNQNIIPIVGDIVNIEVEGDNVGVIKEIIERRNFLVRPAVSNIDQVILTFSMNSPDINYSILDKFLVMVEKKELEVCICINKIDTAKEEELEKIKDVYTLAGYDVIFVSAKEGTGIEQLKAAMKNKVNVFAGPSGVGKSSILNKIQEGLKLQIGDISEKTKRGKHTTRAVELIELEIGGFVLDTPGFTSLEVENIKAEELRFYYKEISEYEGKCKYRTCVHISEPHCEVKEALNEKKISKERYGGYLNLYNELKEKDIKVEESRYKSNRK
ncbi:MAG TPA: ribosome small subunit-dependent GTPase A [Clostridiales bacterium]|nr:MAG: ribosome small subunit-dependent GTPase A [Clostridiales bacterium GWD2_32_19]HCC06734.1 ribosome small subunit-dependent GTPase A [Clostridiales bacterium]